MTTEPREAWNHSHHYIRTKTLETEPETPRSSVERRTPCHKESWSEGWCQQYHARKLSWKHLLENRLLDLGNQLKHILMERKVKRKDEVRHQRRSGVTWPWWRRENTSLLHEGTWQVERPVCSARMPVSQRARICLLRHHSSHDSACRTMW